MTAEGPPFSPKSREQRRIAASQMLIAKLRELTVVSATLNGRSVIVAATVMPHLIFPVLRQLRSFSCVDIATEATKQ